MVIQIQIIHAAKSELLQPQTQANCACFQFSRGYARQCMRVTKNANENDKSIPQRLYMLLFTRAVMHL